MSIWCSGEHIGHDDYEPDRGVVLSYANGWSNHFPDPDNGPERPASLDTAHIPVWCVLGYDSDSNWELIGPWLRLSVNSWAHDWNSGGKTITGPQHVDVILDEEAARALVADLTEWLDQPKAHPGASGEQR